MAPNQRTLEEILTQRRNLDKALDAQQRELVRAWARAWDEIADDMTAAIDDLIDPDATRPVSSVVRAQRSAKALDIASRQVTATAQQAGVSISKTAQGLIDQASRNTLALIGTQLPAGLGVSLVTVNANQLAAIVKRTTQQITVRSYALSLDATEAMKRELLRGVGVGANPRETARRMVNRVQGEFNGGLTRAMVIARTETLDAYRTAARETEKANADVLAGWMWHSELGARTCASCWSMHGSRHETDEPGPLDHHQGRCARLPVTKSWKELGFEGIPEPPATLVSAGEKFAALLEDEQRAILGKRGYEAWAAGEWPMGQWSERRGSEGWRDSYHAAKPPETPTADGV